MKNTEKVVFLRIESDLRCIHEGKMLPKHIISGHIIEQCEDHIRIICKNLLCSIANCEKHGGYTCQASNLDMELIISDEKYLYHSVEEALNGHNITDVIRTN